jgi:predicted DsbA family dithiol-disulfide isomerase
MKIEIFSSPGCGKCGHAKVQLKELVEELNRQATGPAIEWREVNILEDMDYAVDLGVLSTPSLAIDGDLVFTRLPGRKRLLEEIRQRMTKAGELPPSC